jgi:peptide/nickel transport system substrate-binding protein
MGRENMMPSQRWHRVLRLWTVVACSAALAVAAVACSSGGAAPPSAAGPSGGTPVKGGTATIALPPDTTYNWIFPFYAITNASTYNGEQFQFLLYRPLYMFGNNTNTSVSVNYPLSPADAPVYSNGGKTVTVNLKGWKWSDGESVDADDVVFFLNMAKAEKANWYAYSAGLLPDNVVSYKATGADQVTIQLNQAYSSIWYTYNQLAEINPMPMAWDVTSLGAAPGSGGCTTDSAADGWAKCKAVYTFLTAQSKQPASYATSPLWSVVDGPWKLSAFSTDGNVTMVPNPRYSGSPKAQLSAIKFVPFTDDSTEYTALKTGQVDVGYIPPQDLPQKPANASLPATNPLGSAYYLEPFYSFGIEYAQPNFNNPQVGYLVRQLYIRQALQYAMDQPGIDASIWRGYAVPTSGPIPVVPSNQWTPPIEKENDGQGPYPFSLAKAKALLTSHGWSEVNGVMTCQDPAKCGTGITAGEQLKLTFDYAPGITAATDEWQVYKSDASQVGIDITLVGQTFDTIIGESAPCAPMGPKCGVQVFAEGGWDYDGPGFEPTGEPLFQTGAGSNSGNYSDPTMNSLITATHTSNSLTKFYQFATYAAEQLPFIWAPNPNPYLIQAVNSDLHGVTFSPLFTLLPEYWYYTK